MDKKGFPTASTFDMSGSQVYRGLDAILELPAIDVVVPLREVYDWTPIT